MKSRAEFLSFSTGWHESHQHCDMGPVPFSEAYYCDVKSTFIVINFFSGKARTLGISFLDQNPNFFHFSSLKTYKYCRGNLIRKSKERLIR